MSSSKVIAFSYERALSRYEQEHAGEITEGSGPLSSRLSRTPGLSVTQSYPIAKRTKDYHNSFVQSIDQNRGKESSKHVKIVDHSPREQQSSSSQLYDRKMITLEDILNSNIPSDSPPINNTDKKKGNFDMSRNVYVPSRIVSPDSRHTTERLNGSHGGGRMANFDDRNGTQQFGDEDENMGRGYELDDDLLELSGPFEVNDFK